MNVPLTKKQVEALPVRRNGFSGFTATSDGENRKERRVRVSQNTMEFNCRAITTGRINFFKRQQKRFGIIPVLTWLSYRDFQTLLRFRSGLNKAEKKKVATYFEQFSFSSLKQQATAVRKYAKEIIDSFKKKK